MPPNDDLQHLLHDGPLPARELLQRLNISQPTLSRRVAEAGDAIVRFGQARQSAYALRRRVAGQLAFPFYQVSASGQVQTLGEILPVERDGYVVRWQQGQGLLGEGDAFFAGLPWWLEDMRPQGFLGRAFVQQHAARLGLPTDGRLWRDDHVLMALAAAGEDSIGNLIVGEAALSRFLTQSPPQPMPLGERGTRYPPLALQALAGELVGSSAAGEQPKFTATVQDRLETISVLVKFTAPEDNAVTRRWGSLLLAEHLALQTLADAGWPAVATEWLAVGRQYFLQVRRFDRTPTGGRHGLVSLAALDHAFVGQADASWPVIAAVLQQQGHISAATATHIQHLYAFGRLIGNSDMHTGNLSFFNAGMRPLGLTPVYDMLPMQFAPRASGLIPQEWGELRLTTPPALPVWQAVLPLALQFWQRVKAAPQPDTTFVQVAEQALQRLRGIYQRLG